MKFYVPFLVLGLGVVMIIPVYGQVNASCAASLMSSFTPCMNLLTGSTYNGSSSPTSNCCSSLRSLTSRGMDCLCLLALGKVPLPIPRTAAISLPRACKMSGVPFKCQASIAPIPAPGPEAFDSTPPKPEFSPTGSPAAETPSLAPPADTNPVLTRPSPPRGSSDPASAINPITSSSASSPRCRISPALVLLPLVSAYLKCC